MVCSSWPRDPVAYDGTGSLMNIRWKYNNGQHTWSLNFTRTGETWQDAGAVTAMDPAGLVDMLTEHKMFLWHCWVCNGANPAEFTTKHEAFGRLIVHLHTTHSGHPWVTGDDAAPAPLLQCSRCGDEVEVVRATDDVCENCVRAEIVHNGVRTAWQDVKRTTRELLTEVDAYARNVSGLDK